MGEITISIIMPAYNAAKYIGKAIESVMAQTYQNWQLVIVDDGSTDDTLKIACNYSENDEKKRIVVIHQENSGTAAAARNTALDYIDGEYTQILDSDDYLSEDCIQKCVEAIEKSEHKPTIVLPILVSVQDDGKMLGEISRTSDFIGQRIDGQNAFVLSLDWTIHGCMCVASQLLKKIRYDALLIDGDEFTTRKLFANSKFVTVVDASYFYRNNQASTTKSKKNQYRMHETLNTDFNIYQYSVDFGMSKETISKCSKKWMKSIVAHEAHYLRDASQYSIEERAYVEEIIYSNLKNAAKRKAYLHDSSVWGKMIGFCKVNKSRLKCVAILYNLLWYIKRVIKKIKKKVKKNG